MSIFRDSLAAAWQQCSGNIYNAAKGSRRSLTVNRAAARGIKAPSRFVSTAGGPCLQIRRVPGVFWLRWSRLPVVQVPGQPETRNILNLNPNHESESDAPGGRPSLSDQRKWGSQDENGDHFFFLRWYYL